MAATGSPHQKNTNDPLDKISGGIPVGFSAAGIPAHRGVRPGVEPQSDSRKSSQSREMEEDLRSHGNSSVPVLQEKVSRGVV